MRACDFLPLPAFRRIWDALGHVEGGVNRGQDCPNES